MTCPVEARAVGCMPEVCHAGVFLGWTVVESQPRAFPVAAQSTPYHVVCRSLAVPTVYMSLRFKFLSAQVPFALSRVINGIAFRTRK